MRGTLELDRKGERGPSSTPARCGEHTAAMKKWLDVLPQPPRDAGNTNWSGWQNHVIFLNPRAMRGTRWLYAVARLPSPSTPARCGEHRLEDEESPHYSPQPPRDAGNTNEIGYPQSYISLNPRAMRGTRFFGVRPKRIFPSTPARCGEHSFLGFGQSGFFPQPPRDAGNTQNHAGCVQCLHLNPRAMRGTLSLCTSAWRFFPSTPARCGEHSSVILMILWQLSGTRPYLQLISTVIQICVWLNLYQNFGVAAP